MLARRALITFTLGPLALVLIYLGGLFYFLPVSGLVLLATMEYGQLLKKLNWQPSIWLLLVIVALQLVAGQWPELALVGPTLTLSLLAIMLFVFRNYERQETDSAVADLAAMTMGLIMMGWLGSHFFLLRGLDPEAWRWTMLAMLSIWIADSAAYMVGIYLAGRVLGRHRLSPRLSPNKTVEGYAGGIVVGTAITGVIAYFLGLDLATALIVGLAITAIAPAGDLAVSLLKREAGVKDSGTFLPGHGGALDRIDSLVWAVTIAYYLVLLV